MSKSMKLNGFSLYMKERRPALEAEGKTFPGGLKEVAVALNNEWKELTEDQRESYRRRAKGIVEEEQKAKVVPDDQPTTYRGAEVPDLRRTTFGVTFQEIYDRKAAAEALIEKHVMDLRSMMEDADPKKATFILINFNMYGHLLGKLYIPSEVALTAFNVQDGIIDNLCSLIDTYTMPIGIGIDARHTASEQGIPYPPFDNECEDYERILQAIERFVDKHTHSKVEDRKLFCLTDDKPKINGCLNWLYSQLGKRSKFELYSFGEAMRILSHIGVTNRCREEHKNSLEVEINLMEEHRSKVAADFSSMIDSGYKFETRTSKSSAKETLSTSQAFSSRKTPSLRSATANIANWGECDWERVKAGVFYHERQVEDFLSSSELNYDAEISCYYHYNNYDGAEFCALNKTNRYAYNILDVMTNIFNIKELKPCYHMPDIRRNPLKEVKRRETMLREWGIGMKTNETLEFDPKIKPMHRIADPVFGPLDPR